VDLRFSAEEEAFRTEVRDYLEGLLGDEFATVRGVGGPGYEHEAFEERLAWEHRLGDDGWTCLAWPKEHGGRDATVMQQVVWHEEYARAGAPARVGHIGETLVGPTIIAFGTADQKRRFLPGIASGRELWCQGYSEPNAGSDLANLSTRAERDGDEWVITGQKVWTSLAHWAQWVFVLCRTDPSAPKHQGISYLLCPMDQEEIEIRPIVQVTGTSEFNEVFFDGARTSADNVVGEVDGGWRVAMGTLAFERGTSTFGQQLGFQVELARVIDAGRQNGRLEDPVLRQRLVDSWIGLRIMRYTSMRTLSAVGEGGEPGPEASINKLYWATWHRALGELAMDVLGPAATVADGGPADHDLTSAQRLFLFTRSDTIYAGSNQIQRNIIGERVLGLPREPQP
jgi:alkylation response protein AidB-like acyl-CoA dehydrogenase